MKRFLTAVIVTSMLASNSIAFAAEAGAAVDAGITPDSIFYTVDKLFEDLQMVFASSTEEEASLLLKFAQERLAEAKEMTEQEKTQFVETAINDYMTTLELAQDAVLEVVTDEEQDQELEEELIEELEDTTEVDEEIQENLDDEQQQELEEATEQVVFTANVVKNIDVETVASLREQGLGFGQIAHVVVLAEKSGKTIEEITSLVKEDKRGIGEVARELGVQPSEMKPKSLRTAQAAPEEEDGEDTIEETPGDTTESASEPENTEAALSAVSLSSETKSGQDTDKLPAGRTEELKKANKNAAKSGANNQGVQAPEEKKADNIQVQEKKTEETKLQEQAKKAEEVRMQEQIKTEKNDAAEAPKQDDERKEESKDNSSSTETGKDEGAKGGSSSVGNSGGGSSSSSGNGSSGGNSGGGNNGGGSGKK